MAAFAYCWRVFCTQFGFCVLISACMFFLFAFRYFNILVFVICVCVWFECFFTIPGWLSPKENCCTTQGLSVNASCCLTSVQTVVRHAPNLRKMDRWRHLFGVMLQNCWRPAIVWMWKWFWRPGFKLSLLCYTDLSRSGSRVRAIAPLKPTKVTSFTMIL